VSCMRVPYTPASAGLVRRSMTAELAPRLPDAVVDAAAVVVSELVGNAVRHGAALPDGNLVARWEVVDRSLRLEVVDGGGGPAGPVPHARPDAEGGRGLELVEALARSWGSSPASQGTAVWAELTTVICLPD
jgi:serine/threonine-protein kinase RsbW